MQSDYCIAATSRHALADGLEVAVVRGGHATFDDGGETAAQITARNDEELRAEGATLVDAPNAFARATA